LGPAGYGLVDVMDSKRFGAGKTELLEEVDLGGGCGVGEEWPKNFW